MADEEAFDYDAVHPVIPCEFCNQLFPFGETFIEHSTGCNPELTSFGFEDEIIFQEEEIFVPPTATFQLDQAPVSENTNQGVESHQNRPVDFGLAGQNNLNYTDSVEDEPQNPSYDNESVQSFDNLIAQEVKALKIEIASTNITRPEMDKNMQKQNLMVPSMDACDDRELKEETLLSLGSESSRKHLESSESDQEETEDVEDINNLSDDNCSETLEDFWQRASIVINNKRRNLSKNLTVF